MNYSVSFNHKEITGTVNLPASKSISNRILIINALAFNPYPVHNLSDSDDTRVLQEALFSNRNVFDIGHAGTAMRFLTAFLARIAGEWIVTGSERMKQRPIGLLVDALRDLGARIEYMEKEGFPPLKIYGSHLKGKVLELDGSISSQFISALLMIAPAVENGLTLRLTAEITSRPYIELTLNLMSQFGIRYTWEKNEIMIPEQNYLPLDYTVEADWSGASYWFQIAALSESCHLLLPNLALESLQGDSVIATWFRRFGVKAEQTPEGVLLTKVPVELPRELELDFIENPDVAQTFACLCVARGIPFRFTGLKTLKIKETDRIAALQNELAKFGARLSEPKAGELSWNGLLQKLPSETIPLVETYHDHRMALSFAPLALAYPKVYIADPMVITKSYPHFWDDLRQVGFNVTPEIND